MSDVIKKCEANLDDENPCANTAMIRAFVLDVAPIDRARGSKRTATELWMCHDCFGSLQKDGLIVFGTVHHSVAQVQAEYARRRAQNTR